ncbi:unnamed protein product [Amoebophrya sp. A25]|nr:unnamed protein product [Amoebophrya sp. A25]|eukprot:GSA25T00006545001.1
MNCCLQGSSNERGNKAATRLWRAVNEGDAAACENVVRDVYEGVFPGRKFMLDESGSVVDTSIPGYVPGHVVAMHAAVVQAGGVGGINTSGAGVHVLPQQAPGQLSQQQPTVPQYIDYRRLTPQQQHKMLEILEGRNQYGETPLWCSARMGNLRIVQILASGGANLNPENAMMVNQSGARPGGGVLASVVMSASFQPQMTPGRNDAAAPKNPHLDVLAYLVRKGSSVHGFGGGNAPLLVALKTRKEAVAWKLMELSADVWTSKDEFGNTGLHIAAAQTLEGLVMHLIKTSSSASSSTRTVAGSGGTQHSIEAAVKAQNVDGQSVVMSSRLANIGPQLQLSPTGEWLQLRDVPVGSSLVCSCCGSPCRPAGGASNNLNASFRAERIYLGTAPNGYQWVKCQMCAFSPFFPGNHVLACQLALKAGDIYSLTDGVEGCWLAGLTPPNVAAGDLHPVISEAISTLVTTLQAHLKRAIDNEDVQELERGIEMLSYSKIAGLREDNLARDLLVKLKLTRAIKAGKPAELKQGIMTCEQYGRADADKFPQLYELYTEAQDLLEELQLQERLADAVNQLKWALEHEDMRLCAVALRAVEDGRETEKKSRRRSGSEDPDGSPGRKSGISISDGSPGTRRKQAGSLASPLKEGDEKTVNRGWKIFARFLATACREAENELQLAARFSVDEKIRKGLGSPVPSPRDPSKTPSKEKSSSSAVGGGVSPQKLDEIHFALECARTFGIKHAELQVRIDEAANSSNALGQLEKTFTHMIKSHLVSAIQAFDRRALEKSIKLAEKYNATAIVEYDNAKTELVLFPQKQALRLLKDAAKQVTSASGGGPHQRTTSKEPSYRKSQEGKEAAKQLEAALRNLFFSAELKNAGLQNTPEAKEAVDLFKDLHSIPAHFDTGLVVQKLRGGAGGEGVPAYRKPRDELLTIVQEFFDLTMVRKRTRDRRGGVPRAYEAVKVMHVQNHKIWVNYLKGKNKVMRTLEAAENSPDGPTRGAVYPRYNNSRKPEEMVKTLGILPGSNLRFDQCWSKISGEDKNIKTDSNEYYLFHGTKPEAALAITDQDFKINLAGTNAGSLYGRGVYFGECCTKADEYAQERQDGLNPILICRVVLGRVLYEDAIYPDPDNLVSLCVNGDYDSVLGDREKCRGTYREFITYDSDNVYPEFIVWYKRLH